MKKILLIVTLFVFSFSIANAQSFFDKLDDWSRKLEKTVRTIERTTKQVERVVNYSIPRSLFVTNIDVLKSAYIIPTVRGGEVTKVLVDGREISYESGQNICLNPGQCLEIRFLIVKDLTSVIVSYSFYTVMNDGDEIVTELEKSKSQKIKFSRNGDLSRNIDIR